MSQLNVVIVNHTPYELLITTNRSNVSNWQAYADPNQKGNGYDVLLGPGLSAHISCDKDNWFIGGFFKDASVDLTVNFAKPIVVSNGPSTETYPPVEIATMQYKATTFSDWDGNGKIQHLSPHYPQLKMPFVMSNQTSIVVFLG